MSCVVPRRYAFFWCLLSWLRLLNVAFSGERVVRSRINSLSPAQACLIVVFIAIVDDRQQLQRHFKQLFRAVWGFGIKGEAVAGAHFI